MTSPASNSDGDAAASARRNIVTWKLRTGSQSRLDDLAPEEPLEIRVETHPISVTMRTPGHDRELAAGFLLAEGIVSNPADVVRIRPYVRNRKGNVLDVHLAEGVRVDLKRLTRHVFASSSCGLCGKATIEALQHRFPPIRTRAHFDANMLLRLPGRMKRGQAVFQRTGGLHAAALFDAQGNLRVLREDVGRHNAVDKVVGHAFLQGPWPLVEGILLVSGRASFEIMQKALAGRIPLVASVSAPSALAVDFARANGQTLVGFLRGQSMNVYAGRKRISFGKKA